MATNQKEMKNKILLIAKWLVFRCSEYTPPKVKSSRINYLVAEITLKIDELIKELQ